MLLVTLDTVDPSRYNFVIMSAFEKLVAIMKRLRDPNGGCPWDLEQTHQTLKPYLIEETYEVLDAIDQGPSKLQEELGDLLLQVVFHSQLASENKEFTVEQVAEGICNKLIERHPHVFGDKKVSGSKEVLKNWEEIKKSTSAKESVLDGVPRSMPALLRAQRIGEKAARVGFEWNTLEEVRDKVFEEMREFLECSTAPNTTRSKIEDEFGDILFALTQLARRLDVSGEQLLSRATDKFERRFRQMEKETGGKLKEKSLEELDALWEKIKQNE